MGASEARSHKALRLLANRGFTLYNRIEALEEVLIAASIGGDVILCETLLDICVDVNAVLSRRTALSAAAKMGNLELCHMLVKRGANVVGTPDTDSPLHC